VATNDKRLIALARRHLPPAVAEQWIGLMRPALRLRTCSEDSRKRVGQLGGLPALPDGVAWPEWEGEGSLNFVASIDCGRLASDRLDIGLPGEGTLLFFYFDPEDGDFDPDFPPGTVLSSKPETLAGARVLYLPPGMSAIERAAPADINPYDRVLLRAELIATGPACDHPALIHGLSDEDRAFMSDPSNSDPFAMAVSEQVPRPQHWIGGRGDVGTLYWLIRPEDLAARRFEASSFTWQCS
jgi:Domain of unknown function (DUF1963)